MERFLQLATKLLLERKAKGGEGNNWVNGLLVRIFDTETDPTLYNDKWENPAGKHRPAIQKGAPQMFAVTRDSFIEHGGLEVLAGAVQVKIDEIARLQRSEAGTGRAYFFEGRPAVSISVERGPTGDALAIQSKVLEIGEAFVAKAPEDLRIDLMRNAAAGIAPGAVRRPFAKLEPRTWRDAGSAPCTAAVSNIRGEP